MNKTTFSYRLYLHIATLLVSLFFVSGLYGQTPGLIYKPAATVLGRSVLDPNGDGYVSATMAGFTGPNDWGVYSELKMAALPAIGAGEPHSDLTTGSAGGQTDLVTPTSSLIDGSNHSSYILTKTIGTTKYLIFRVRLGKASTASKGYSFMIDIDGKFDRTGINPCFEREVVLETGKGVVINSFNAIDGTLTETTVPPLPESEYSQRSIAYSTVNGDLDVFYDFFIPYNDLKLGAGTLVRVCSATITSAASGIGGTKSDFSGINDKLYGNNPEAISKALIDAFPPTDLESLMGEDPAFPKATSLTPLVNTGIEMNDTSIKGSSAEAFGTEIEVFRDRGGVVFSLGKTTVQIGNTWTLTDLTGEKALAKDDLISAKATAIDKLPSAESNIVRVTAVQSCFTPAPVNISRPNGSTYSVKGTWTGSVPTGGTVEIKLYSQTEIATYVEVTNGGPTATVTNTGPVYVDLATGNWEFFTHNKDTFAATNYAATATIKVGGVAVCESGLSDISVKPNGGGSTAKVTPAPSIVTSTAVHTAPHITENSGVTTITVKNDGQGGSAILGSPVQAHIKLYVNGVQVAITPTAMPIAPNAYATFLYTGFIKGDVITAIAFGTDPVYWDSHQSNAIVVTEVINGTSTPLQS